MDTVDKPRYDIENFFDP
ncbi:MAG TPA: hypothetical protein LFW21_05285 [Rickettsia endosymbiont of Pyrocoelia pectoralis]|nr:hypothetical protein [Rickettsia endosymbiont of Pyrocoelia pectoralis]